MHDHSLIFAVYIPPFMYTSWSASSSVQMLTGGEYKRNPRNKLTSWYGATTQLLQENLRHDSKLEDDWAVAPSLTSPAASTEKPLLVLRAKWGTSGSDHQ